MDRQFALPLAFAAAFHAALLFGFPKKPRASVSAIPRVPPSDFRIPVVELDSVEILETDSASREPKPVITAPQPRAPEPPTIDLGVGPTMPVPTPQPFSPGDVRTIELPRAGPDVGTGDGLGKGIIRSDLLDNPPRTRFQAAPIYPFEAKRSGVSGDVLVEFVVDVRGHVREPRVVSSSNRIFEEPTLRAVAKWQFEPGRRDGRIVTFKMVVPVVFNLNE